MSGKICVLLQSKGAFTVIGTIHQCGCLRTNIAPWAIFLVAFASAEGTLKRPTVVSFKRSKF